MEGSSGPELEAHGVPMQHQRFQGPSGLIGRGYISRPCGLRCPPLSKCGIGCGVFMRLSSRVSNRQAARPRVCSNHRGQTVGVPW